jgi:hypothetical protein
MATTRRGVLTALSIAVGLIVALGLAEMIVRLLSLAGSVERGSGGYVADTYLPFKPKPLSRTEGRTDEFEYDYRHNRFGFRDLEHAVRKRPGTFRLLGLGDSFTYGVGVAFEQTFLHVLESMLNSRDGRHPTVEIIKAGIPRFFPEPERILLEQYGLQFRPDVVLVAFLLNDLVDTQHGINAVEIDGYGHLIRREAKELGPVAMEISRHSHLGRFLLRSYVDWQVRRNYPAREDRLSEGGGPHEREWLTVESEYERMVAIAGSIGAKVVIVHIPQQGPWTSSSRYPSTRLAEWAMERAVAFVDLLPAMEEASRHERLYYEKDGHCTPAGHAIIAQELYRHLVARRLVP